MISKVIQRIKLSIKFMGKEDGSIGKKIIRSGIWLSIASGTNNILGLVRTVVLARLLEPEMFGVMGICMVIIRGVQIFTETGFWAALIQRQSDIEEIKDTAFTLMVIRGIALAVITFALSSIIAVYYEEPILEILIEVLAISFIFQGFRNVNTVKLQKGLNFKKIAYLEQARVLIGTIAVITLAYYLRSVWALILGYVLATFIATVLSYILIPGRIRFAFNKEHVKELVNYGKFIAGATIIGFIAFKLDNLVIGKMLGMEILGFYVLAFQLGNLPATHISQLVSGVMFPAYSKLLDDLEKLRSVYLKALNLVAIVAIPAAVGLAALSKEFITVLYGDKWLPSAEILVVLCIFGGIHAIISLNGYLFNALGKPNINMRFSILRFTCISALIYPLTKYYGATGTAFTIMIPLIIELFVSMWLLKKHVGLDLMKVINILVPKIITSAIMGLVIIYIRSMVSVVDAYTLAMLVISGMVVMAIFNINMIMVYMRKRSLST